MSRTALPSNRTAQKQAQPPADGWRAAAISVLLVLAIGLVYGPVLGHPFLNYDDSIYVFGQSQVTAGLTWPGLVWAFTNGPHGEWYPLTMLSHMLDCQLFGLEAGWHHLTNLLLHAATTVVLFLVLRRMTGQRAVPEAAQASGVRVAAAGPSATTLCGAMVAALFALHPLRVESVAWVAERRDVLSGLFFVLTLAAYTGFVRHGRSPWRYLILLVVFTLGLLAKPMLVTVPPLLLLLDYWPLGRIFRDPKDGGTSVRASFDWRVIWEKLPLVALALAAAAKTMGTHSSRPDPLSLTERLANAAIAYVAYLGQLFVPLGLSPFYSYPESGWPAWQVASAVALLLAISVAAVILWRACPYLFVGWFWYLGMLVPVLGLTHVGTHARADRYTYLSQIGLYLTLVWGVVRLADRWPARRWVLGIGSSAIVAAMMLGTWQQQEYWRDSTTLWRRAVACDPEGVTPNYLLATALRETDEPAAVAQLHKVLEIAPGERNIYYWIRARASSDLADIAAKNGDLADAQRRYEEALRFEPESALVQMSLGRLLATQGHFDEAQLHFHRALELAEDNPAIYVDVAIEQAQHGDTGEAIENFRKAIRIDRNSGVAQLQLGILLSERGEAGEATEHLRRAIEIDPDVPLAYDRLIPLLREQGNGSEALKYEALRRRAARRWAEAQAPAR